MLNRRVSQRGVICESRSNELGDIVRCDVTVARDDYFCPSIKPTMLKRDLCEQLVESKLAEPWTIELPTAPASQCGVPVFHVLLGSRFRLRLARSSAHLHSTPTKPRVRLWSVIDERVKGRAPHRPHFRGRLKLKKIAPSTPLRQTR